MIFRQNRRQQSNGNKINVLLYILLLIVVILISVYLVVVGYLFFNQKHMVFFPTLEISTTPADLNIKYEEITLAVNDTESIHGWYFPASDSSVNKAVLFCHGNAGNISNRLYTAALFQSLDIPFFLFDYRGYGKSVGSLSEENVYVDGRQCYDWLIEQKGFKPENIIIFGRSLGGAVCAELAGNVVVGGIIMESTFTSASELGQKLFPIFPIKLFLKYRFNSLAKIEKINCPVLVIHSPDDDLIPYEMGRHIFEKASQPKEFFEIEGSHNNRDYLSNPEYIEKIRSFITGTHSE